MQVQFLGSGSMMPSKGNFHSNILITSENNHRLLIDCGSDIRHSLAKRGLSFDDIDAVYISHLHDDHAGGLEQLGFYSYFVRSSKPQLIIHDDICDKLWSEKLAISMEQLTDKMGHLSNFFTVKRVNQAFKWEKVQFNVIPSIHVVNKVVGHMYSYGLRFRTKSEYNKNVYFTSDITFINKKIDKEDWDLDAHWQNYEKANIIFHDCDDSNQAEVHPHYDFLKEFPESIKSKMWLYHCKQHNFHQQAKDDGFAGVVKPGQAFQC